MPEILQLAHLIEHHRMAKMQIGRGRIEPELDPQMAASLKLFLHFRLKDQLFGATFDNVELLNYR